MIAGKHILHFGGEFLVYRDDSTAWGNTNAGTMNFSAQYTEQWTLDSKGVASPNTTTGLEYADFLLGYAQSWNAGVSPEYGARLKSPQMFIQDDWKLKPNLTINVGLRYQINHGWNETHGNEDVFDPTIVNTGNGTLGGIWYGSTHTNGRTSLQDDVYNTFLPRVGFSWLPRNDMTIRGAWGLYAYNWSLDTYGGGMGNAFGGSGSLSDQTNGIKPITQLDGTGTNFQTGAALPYSQASTDPARFNGQSVTYNQYKTPVPKIYQWNLAIQKQLGSAYVAEVAYVGSHGFDLNYPTDLNAVPTYDFSSSDTSTCGQGTVVGCSRPYTNYTNIAGSSNNGISNYNSLQASITKRMTNGLSLSFNYVWSHFLDDQDSSGWGSREGPQNYQEANNPGANYSNSNFDIRHAFKGYAVYQLPFGKGKMFLNHNALLDEAVGGWQLSTTINLSTGNPFSVFGTQQTYQGAGSAFPNRVIGVSTKAPHQATRCQPGSGSTDPDGDTLGCINEWYNPAAYSLPANGTFGDVRRNSLYGPGIDQVNISAGKTFSVPWENIKVGIRADASNAFNHASFSPPTGTLFGQANQQVGDPYTYYTQDKVTKAYTVPTQQTSGTTVGGRNIQFGVRVSF
jgi:TonB dependent receptor